jgi:hypothetical protein
VLGYQDTSLKEMTLQNRINTPLSDTEYDDMLALKNAINYDISTVVPEKMEEFSDRRIVL